MLRFLASLERQNKFAVLLAGFAIIGVIGVIDFASGYEFALSLFYVLPIALITWLTSRRYGVAASIVSSLVWLGADLGTGHTYSHPLIPFWNSLIRLAYFILITLLLAALHRALRREGELARVDYLTGADNSRSFYNLARLELERLRRYQRPLTLAYIDLDNFKTVNDQLGHSTGDQVLRSVAGAIHGQIRRTDVLARLGGDEFVVMFPETDQASAQAVLAKLHATLLAEMNRAGWPVTFSVGVITCTAAPASIDDLVKLADELMYTVKHETKHALRYAVYAG
jgi:diguanylate cyclase (GGDEF)-like protein